MTHTQQVLDQVKKALGNVSSYRAAKELGVSRAAVSLWENGKTYMADAQAAKSAEILGLPKESIMALIAADRAKDENSRTIWTKLAKRLRNPATTACLIAALLAASSTHQIIIDKSQNAPAVAENALW